jgi:hypothetical protein
MRITDLVDTLIADQSEICVTIYQDTHKMNSEAQQDPVRFKNQLKEAGEKMLAAGMDKQKTDELLEKAKAKTSGHKFWNYQDEGLALFISENTLELLQLPHKTGNKVRVEQEFYIRPLLPLVHLDTEYYVLSLSKAEIHLYKTDGYYAEEMELNDIPESYEEFRQFDVEEKHLGSTSDNTGTHVTHGRGAASEDEYRHEKEFLKQVENGVTTFMRTKEEPMIIAGLKDITSEYKSINHYHQTWEDVIEIRPADLREQELIEKSREMMHAHMNEQQNDQIDSYADYAGGEKFEDDLTLIAKAAVRGQVEALFLNKGASHNGIHPEQMEQGEEDQNKLLSEIENTTAVTVLKNGGTVWDLNPSKIPANKTVAAVLRYAIEAEV